MERELKLVFIVFLTYLIFGLTSWFQTGSLITPVFLTKIILVVLSLIFLLMNLRQRNSWILIFCFFAFTAYAFTDDFVLSYLSQKFQNFEQHFTKTDFWAWVSFGIFFSFLFTALIFFWFQSKNRVITLLLLSDLLFCLFLFFTDSGWIQEISIKVFFTVFFIFGQIGSDLNNKTLRVLSYQFLGLVLLESFEYFI